MPRRVRPSPVAPSFPPVRVVTGEAFELVAEIAAFTSGPGRASLDSGKAWIREVRRLAGAELLKRTERYNLSVYAGLATIALEAAAPRGADELISAMAAMPAEAFRLRLLGADSPMNRAMFSEGALERAVAGDRRARAEILSAFGADTALRQATNRLLDSTADGFQQEIHAIITDWSRRVFPRFAPDALAAIARDAAAKERLLAEGPDQAALAEAMNGVAFNPSPWVTEVALIPTVALRPFVVPAELHGTAVFIYSVADEAFDADPGAPPRRLVKVAAALGDELRLRILRVVMDEQLSASEIADRLGVDRTSLHHHLGILRSAGLLSIRDDGVQGWRYVLRDDGFGEIGPWLSSYLRPARRGSRT